jgi:uncharacterized membrane protein YbaN (DUF454 family)
MTERPRFDGNANRQHHFVCQESGFVRGFQCEALDGVTVPDEARRLAIPKTVHLPHERQMKRSSVRRCLLTITGIIAVVLGAVGVFVPLLPTTPFLLLAAACFIRSSERLYAWLIHHRWFGSYIRNYREHCAVTLRAKVIALALLWMVIGYSAVVVVDSWLLRVVLAVIAVGVTIHLLHLRTLARDVALLPSDVGDDALESPGKRKRENPKPV